MSEKQISRDRIRENLATILREKTDMEDLLRRFSDQELLQDRHRLKSLKLSVILINEAMGNILQHLLAKAFGDVVEGYQQTIEKAHSRRIISEDLAGRLKPFVGFRNMLVHQYWRISDDLFLENLRDNLSDFDDFGREIRRWVEENA
ncbi:MAG: DUF86 domain-containing protein [Desulfacinum sp.]|nr:DUF86 domain-containing protein [Desulfacinum sp.]MBZ4659221.1 hypothetical protein [Desulfacinum sp.]